MMALVQIRVAERLASTSLTCCIEPFSKITECHIVAAGVDRAVTGAHLQGANVAQAVVDDAPSTPAQNELTLVG